MAEVSQHLDGPREFDVYFSIRDLEELKTWIGHAGQQHVLFELQNKYWVVRANSTVRFWLIVRTAVKDFLIFWDKKWPICLNRNQILLNHLFPM